ncbi:MAG: transcriptional regulator [Deltaproteobacteria bacterium]|nr:transcriptional regulator [Candidatus Zymogenaceae bacterium]
MNHKRKGLTRRIIVGVVFLGVIAAAVWADRVIYRLLIEPPPPPGWTVIRPPINVMTLEIQGDTVWAGGMDGVCAIDIKTRTLTRTIESEPPLSYVKDILADDTGSVWIAHFDGLSRWDGERLVTYTTKDGLPDNRVNALLIDRQGSLWVGTWGGVAIIRDRDFSRIETITTAQGLINNMVNVMLEDSRGGMWFGSHAAPAGGISLYRDGRWHYFTVREGLAHNDITSFLQQTPDKIWVGTGYFERGGAVLFAPEAEAWRIDRVLTKKDGLAGWRVRTIFLDSAGDLWFGSETDGVARLRDGDFSILSKRDGFPHQEITSIIEDEDKNLWFGTLGGVTVIERAALSPAR